MMYAIFQLVTFTLIHLYFEMIFLKVYFCFLYIIQYNFIVYLFRWNKKQNLEWMEKFAFAIVIFGLYSKKRVLGYVI